MYFVSYFKMLDLSHSSSINLPSNTLILVFVFINWILIYLAPLLFFQALNFSFCIEIQPINNGVIVSGEQ